MELVLFFFVAGNLSNTKEAILLGWYVTYAVLWLIPAALMTLVCWNSVFQSPGIHPRLTAGGVLKEAGVAELAQRCGKKNRW